MHDHQASPTMHPARFIRTTSVPKETKSWYTTQTQPITHNTKCIHHPTFQWLTQHSTTSTKPKFSSSNTLAAGTSTNTITTKPIQHIPLNNISVTPLTMSLSESLNNCNNSNYSNFSESSTFSTGNHMNWLVCGAFCWLWLAGCVVF